MPAAPSFLPPDSALQAFIDAHGAVAITPAAYARQAIKAYVSKRWQLNIDPDDVRLNTFIYNAVPSATHCPATLHSSISLTEALLIKWQEHLHWYSGLGSVQAYRPGGLPLQLVPKLSPVYTPLVYEGLYRRSEPQTYDAATQLNIDPAQIKAFIWQTDLRDQYGRYLEQFIRDHASAFPVLCKAALVKAVLLQRDEHSLRDVDQELVLRSLGLPASQQWQTLTPELLDSPVTADPHLTVAPLQVHRYCATDVLIIKDKASGRAVLYIPGNSSPLHGFDSEASLARWVARQCRDPGKRLALEGHFRERDDSDGIFLTGVTRTLAGVALYPHWLDAATGSWSPRHCIHAGKPIKGDPFVQVRERMIERMRSDATQSIRTRGNARLEGFALGLDRSLLFTGLVALVVPEAAPLMIGLGLTLMGVGADQAAGGRSFQERRTGGQRVVFGLLNALPLVTEHLVGLLDDAGDVGVDVDEAIVADGFKPGSRPAVEMNEPQASAVIRPRFDVAPPNLRSLEARQRLALRKFEAPPESVQGLPTIHGPNGMPDIFHRDGRYFLVIHDKAYEARWEETARQWRLTSADGSEHPGPFVKQLDNDQWDIDIGGLKGGMDSDQVVPVAAASQRGPSLIEQVQRLYPGFTPPQSAEFLAGLRANGVSLEIQLARLSTEFQSLERALERWARGPVSWRAVTDTYSVPVSELSRRQAADIIKRCWQRQTPVAGAAARRLSGYMLDLHGITTGDLPHLPGNFSHVTALNLSRTYISEQSASELITKMPGLRWLNIENNFLRGVPSGVRHLQSLTRLTLANNRITLTPFMTATLRPLHNLRLLNLERNPLGSFLDVSTLPRLVNLFLRSTGIEQAPQGVFELPEMIALDLRSNRITTLPDEFFTSPRAAHHTLLDNNPLTIGTRARIARIGGPSFAIEPVEGVEVWLQRTPALARPQRRLLWDLYWAQEGAESFFEVLTRLRNSADFNLSPDTVSDRVWQLMEAGTDDPALRGRLVAMAADPETCVDGATVMFSNMELEVRVTQARASAAAGREGPQLLKLVRGLARLEEVDGIARQDVAARTGFTEDVEVLLAYRVGLATRLELPVNTRTMQFSTSAQVSQAMLDQAAQRVLAGETPDALVEFALQREFWLNYLENRYPDQLLACRKPTELRMEALEELQSEGRMTDGAYKDAADQILRQRRVDEAALMKQLTQAEMTEGSGGNEV